MSWPPPPGGFELRDLGARALYLSDAARDEALAFGLDRTETWEQALAAGGAVSGRGATAVLAREGATPWRLKRMRRGGATARLWKDRYPDPGRLLAILAASSEALARGIPGAVPVALLIARGPAWLVRGWMASEEIAGAEDLGSLLRRGALTRSELAAAMAAVRRMHDRGLVHPDLNLGNVLVRARGPEVEAFIIDLDRARLGPGAVALSCRRAAIRRLARSCAKISGSEGALGAGTEDLWYELYADGDADLARRLRRGRGWGRLALFRHGSRWKDAPR